MKKEKIYTNCMLLGLGSMFLITGCKQKSATIISNTETNTTSVSTNAFYSPNRGTEASSSRATTLSPTGNDTNAAPRDYSSYDASSGSSQTKAEATSEADRILLQQLQKSINDDTSLTMFAKNIRPVVKNGRVGLYGTVNSTVERDRVVELAQRVAGASNVDNHMEVMSSQ
jgi:hypothetical protein